MRFLSNIYAHDEQLLKLAASAMSYDIEIRDDAVSTVGQVLPECVAVYLNEPIGTDTKALWDEFHRLKKNALPAMQNDFTNTKIGFGCREATAVCLEEGEGTVVHRPRHDGKAEFTLEQLRRIVQCVNACQGMKTPETDIPTWKILMAEASQKIDELIAQKKELIRVAEQAEARVRSQRLKLELRYAVHNARR